MSRRSRRSETQPKYTPDELDPEHDIDANAEDEADVVDDDEGEITRCICGRAELDADASDSGFFIQCEGCSVWQHGYCVGIPVEDVAPDTYWCELCKPQMHTLYKDEDGNTRSKYEPKRAHGNNRTRQDPRDHHYETMLKRALEESARESNSGSSNKNDGQTDKVKTENKKPETLQPISSSSVLTPTTNQKSRSITPPAKESKPKKGSKKSNISKVSKQSTSINTSSVPGPNSGSFKANLPNSRISTAEMTRRVYAIMEFLANIQTNLSAEDKFRDILQELGTRDLDRSISGIRETLVKQYNDCVEGVDDLMALVNEWVQLYDV